MTVKILRSLGTALLVAGCSPQSPALPPIEPMVEGAQASSAQLANRAAAQPSASLQAGVLPPADAARRYRLDQQLVARHNAPSPVMMEVMTLDGRSGFGRDRHVTLLLLLLAGEAVVEDDAGGSWSMRRWSALQVPGAGVTLRAQQAQMWLAFVGDGEQPLYSDRPWQQRPAAITQRQLDEVAPLSWAGGRMHARIGFEQGPASLSLLYGGAKVGVPPHRHPDSWEVIRLLQTSGSFRHGVAPDGGLSDGLSKALTGGTVVAVEPPLEHTFEPDGKTPLFAVQLYVPPGPEQRFKQLATSKPAASL